MNLNDKNKKYLPTASDILRKWWVVDAQDLILGRLATKVANILRGRDKAMYTPFMDTGDFVVVINADKVRVTGAKLDQKMYYRHSGYLGGIKEASLQDLLTKHPERVIQLAVKGMLPKNRLNRRILKKLKVYSGSAHQHQAQKPEKLEI